jgi:hypothetical protein
MNDILDSVTVTVVTVAQAQLNPGRVRQVAAPPGWRP